MMRKIIIILFVLFMLAGTASASSDWENLSWSYRIDNALPDNVRPYQYILNISNSTGTNNVTHIFCGGKCNVDFSDIRFTLDNITTLPYWIEDNATGKVWVNVTANGTVNMYYGNPSAISTSDISKTAPFGDDFNNNTISVSVSTGSATIAAWGSVSRLNATTFFRSLRKGTSHTTGGEIVYTLYDQNSQTWSGYTQIYKDSYDDRNTVSGMIGDNIYVFFARCGATGTCSTGTDFVDVGYIILYSNLTMKQNYTVVFQSGANNESYSPYGKIEKINDSTYVVPLYGINNLSSTQWTRLLKTTDSGATWELTPFIDNSASSLSEFEVVHIGNGQLIAQIRTDGGSAYIKQSTSPDAGETWTAVTNTNLGHATNTKFISNYYDAEDNTLISWYGEDSGLFTFYYSKTNATTIYNNANAYSTSFAVVVSGGSYLANPSMTKIRTGNYLLVYGYGSTGDNLKDYSIAHPSNWLLMTGTAPTFINGNMIVDNGWVYNPLITFGQNYQLIFNATESTTSAKQQSGFSTQIVVGASSDMCNSIYSYACFYFYNPTNIYLQNAETLQTQVSGGATNTNPHTYKIIRNGSTNDRYLRDDIDLSNSPISTNVMVSPGYIHLLDYLNSIGSMNFNWLMVIPYIYPVATWAVWGIEESQPQILPIIYIVNNTKTNDTTTSKIFLNNSEAITFFADADQDILTWNWSVDHVLQSNNSNNLTTLWSTGKYHYVSLTGSNTHGSSNTLTWGVNVYPAMATATIGALNETPANEIRAALENKDAPALVMATVLPFTNLIGAFFYAIVWFIVFVMMWIKQKSMNIPMVIGIIFGGLIISFLPEQYQLVATALIVLGIFGIIYIFFRGRG